MSIEAKSFGAPGSPLTPTSALPETIFSPVSKPREVPQSDQLGAGSEHTAFNQHLRVLRKSRALSAGGTWGGCIGHSDGPKIIESLCPDFNVCSEKNISYFLMFL